MESIMAGQTMLLSGNPRAGSYRAQNTFLEAAGIIFRSEYKAYLYSTQYPGDAARIVAETGADYDVVVCFGGDGTLNEVINGIMHLEKRPVLGYIPAGTTNDFASGLGLSRNIIEAARDVLNGHCISLDVGCFNNERYFSYVASFGSFTKASYSAPQDMKNALGYSAYLLEGLKSIWDFHPYRVRIKTETMEIEDEFIFGGISNSTSLGGILKLNISDVDLCDGLFEVMLVRNPKNLLQIQKLLHSVTTRNYENDQIFFFKTDFIELYCDQSIAWTIDGEFGGVSNEIGIKNHHNAVTIIKPKPKDS
jgi:YegS/Rv2252/BmrU family lipid kinase